MTPLDEQDGIGLYSYRIKVKEDPVDIAALSATRSILLRLFPRKRESTGQV